MKVDFAKKEEVLKLLEKGCEIYSSRNEVLGKKRQTVYLSRSWEISDCKKINRPIHHSTILSLMKSGVIMNKAPYHIIHNHSTTDNNK